MNTKTSIYIVISLILFIVFQYFHFNMKIKNLSQLNIEIKEEKLEEIRKVRDSAINKIENITYESNKRFDSILAIPPKIKWKKYEKPIYIDRTLDDALDIISKYEYDSGTKK